MKNCILYLSHIINDDIVNHFLKLKNDVKKTYDIYFIFDSNSNYYFETKKYADKIDFICINSKKQLNELGYERFDNNTTIGIAYWFLQYFVIKLNHKEYDNYWLMEYDVIFNGNYNDFFSDIDDNIHNDFVTQITESYYDSMDWYWWKDYANFNIDEKYYNYNKNYLFHSFNPIFRLSINAIMFMDCFLKTNKVNGHYEYLLITLLFNNGFSIFSINDDKNLQFTNDKYNKKYCNQNTFKYRPFITINDIINNSVNFLYHPFKYT